MSKEKIIYHSNSDLLLLTLLFIVLKLCNIINWSWIWVISPLWIGYGIFFIILLILLIILAITKYKGRYKN